MPFQQQKIWDSTCQGHRVVSLLVLSPVKVSALLLKHLLSCKQEQNIIKWLTFLILERLVCLNRENKTPWADYLQHYYTRTVQKQSPHHSQIPMNCDIVFANMAKRYQLHCFYELPYLYNCLLPKSWGWLLKFVKKKIAKSIWRVLEEWREGTNLLLWEPERYSTLCNYRAIKFIPR